MSNDKLNKMDKELLEELKKSVETPDPTIKEALTIVNQAIDMCEFFDLRTANIRLDCLKVIKNALIKVKTNDSKKED